MLRKCKVGKEHRPALFHEWFQFGNAENGMDGMAIVEFEDGTTDCFSPCFISFDTPPISEAVVRLPKSPNSDYATAARVWKEFDTCESPNTDVDFLKWCEQRIRSGEQKGARHE